MTAKYDVYWAPEGRRIATVEAESERDALRKAPQPYRRFLGELYATRQRFCPMCGGDTYLGRLGVNERTCPTCHGGGLIDIAEWEE